VSIDGPVTAGQKAFGEELAKITGLSPQVVGAWMLAENSDQNAIEKDASGYHNWLNIGPFAKDARFADPVSAAQLTKDWLEGQDDTPGYGAADSIQQSILPSAGKSDEEQMAAIEGSAFSATGYGAGGSLAGTYSQVKGSTADIPKGLLRKGKAALGKEQVQNILSGGAPSTAPAVKKLKGPYAGSREKVRQIIGANVRGDHGGTKYGEAPGEHDPDGDHYAAEGYAQDINNMNPRENEPAYNQQSLDTIVRNLKKQGVSDPNLDGLQIGENWEGPVGGYYVQVLTNEGGNISHIHVGARWQGEGAATAAGTASGAPAATGGAAVASGIPALAGAGAASAGPGQMRGGLPAARMSAQERLANVMNLREGGLDNLLGLPMTSESEATDTTEEDAAAADAAAAFEELRRRGLRRR
jgi:hypothetical protein